MRTSTVWAILLLLGTSLAAAQVQPQAKQNRSHPEDADRLGMTCAQILEMSSSEWIAKVTSIDDSNVDGQLRGIKTYGTCYDERTDRLAASLARTRKGPRAAAKRSLQDLTAALDDFTAKGLADSEPPADAVKRAYAALYEKQFRYEFYESFEAKKAAAPPQASAQAATSASAAADTHPAADGKASGAPVPEMTRAKNRFGELLDAMPPDKLHEVHSTFGKVLDVQPLAGTQELAIYRYAIFVLESPSPPAGSRAGATGAAAAKQMKPFVAPPF